MGSLFAFARILCSLSKRSVDPAIGAAGMNGEATSAQFRLIPCSLLQGASFFEVRDIQSLEGEMSEKSVETSAMFRIWLALYDSVSRIVVQIT